MSQTVYVEVVDNRTDEVIKRVGPMPEWKAGRVEMGLVMQLDYEHYFTRIVGQSIDERS